MGSEPAVNERVLVDGKSGNGDESEAAEVDETGERDVDGDAEALDRGEDGAQTLELVSGGLAGRGIVCFLSTVPKYDVRTCLNVKRRE